MSDETLNSQEGIPGVRGDSGDTRVIESLSHEGDIEKAIDTIQEPSVKPEKVKVPKVQQQGQKFRRDSWLNRNVQSIMALLVLIFAFVFFAYVLQFDFSDVSKLKDIIVLLIGIVSTLVTTVIAYFFGSSKGSADKSNRMERNSSLNL